MATYAIPTKRFFSQEPFVIIPAPGVWIFQNVGPVKMERAFDNCTLPSSWYPPHNAVWDSYVINWSLCDWITSFGRPDTTIPTTDEVIAYLTGPTWQAGKKCCDTSGGGGGGGDNIYTIDGVIADPVRTVDVTGKVLTFQGGITNLNGVATNVTGTNMIVTNTSTSVDSGVINLKAVDVRLEGTPDVTLVTAPPNGVLGAGTHVLLRNDATGNIEQIPSSSVAPNNIYLNDGTLVSDRVLSTDDKKLNIRLDTTTSHFLVSQDVGTFPPSNPESAAVYVSGGPFFGNPPGITAPAAILGYLKDPVVNNSVGVLAGEVPGIKSIMINSVDFTPGSEIVNIHQIDDNGIHSQASSAASNFSGGLDVTFDQLDLRLTKNGTIITNATLVPEQLDLKVDSSGTLSQITMRPKELYLDSPQVFLTQVPPTDNTIDFLVVRDSGDNQIKLRDVASLPGGGGVNVYNSNGNLTGHRTMNATGFDFTYQGNTALENYSILNIRTLLLQASGSATTDVAGGTINLNANAVGTININGGIVRLPTDPPFDNLLTRALVVDSVSKQIKLRTMPVNVFFQGLNTLTFGGSSGAFAIPGTFTTDIVNNITYLPGPPNRLRVDYAGFYRITLMIELDQTATNYLDSYVVTMGPTTARFENAVAPLAAGVSKVNSITASKTINYAVGQLLPLNLSGVFVSTGPVPPNAVARVLINVERVII